MMRALVLTGLLLLAGLPAGVAAAPILNPMVEDTGGGSVACINVVSLRYYLCVRADGSSYRIYY